MEEEGGMLCNLHCVHEGGYSFSHNALHDSGDSGDKDNVEIGSAAAPNGVCLMCPQPDVSMA